MKRWACRAAPLSQSPTRNSQIGDIDRDNMVESDLRREVSMNIKRLMVSVAIADCATVVAWVRGKDRTPTPAPARARRSDSGQEEVGENHQDRALGRQG